MLKSLCKNFSIVFRWLCWWIHAIREPICFLLCFNSVLITSRFYTCKLVPDMLTKVINKPSVVIICCQTFTGDMQETICFSLLISSCLPHMPVTCSTFSRTSMIRLWTRVTDLMTLINTRVRAFTPFTGTLYA